MNGINWTMIIRTVFRKKLLAFTRPVGNSIYGIYHPFRVRLINRLRLGFSHLREYKFRHNFANIADTSSQ